MRQAVICSSISIRVPPTGACARRKRANQKSCWATIMNGPPACIPSSWRAGWTTSFRCSTHRKRRTSSSSLLVEEHYRSTQEIYATELQQIWEQPRHHTVIGGRYQLGEFHTRNLQTNPVVLGEIIGYFDPSVPLADQDVRSDFHRWSVYAYHNWQILPALQIAGCLAYDWIKFPDNFRQAPVSDNEQRTDRISPKGGFVWTPAENSVVRFAYTRSLAGASIDQTYLLEPSQVAGFNQSFRSIIPESVGGAEAGARFEIFGLALEQKFGSG